MEGIERLQFVHERVAEGASYGELAGELHISRQRVQQLHRAARQKLGHPLSAAERLVIALECARLDLQHARDPNASPTIRAAARRRARQWVRWVQLIHTHRASSLDTGGLD